MKIGIMQPYFFPYLGYFSLIKHTDRFILFDTVQFIRHGWIERNRILNPNGDWQYIKVPLVKFSQSTIIKDIQINNNISWRENFAQLQHYKKSPNYTIVIELLEDIFSADYFDIVSLDLNSLIKVADYLGINTSIEVFSSMGLAIEKVNAPDEWALNICKALGNVEEYWNPPGGASFFDKVKYEKAGIKLKFHSIKLTEYIQRQSIFIPGLSIIDVMMFNSINDINEMLDNYEFV